MFKKVMITVLAITAVCGTIFGVLKATEKV